MQRLQRSESVNTASPAALQVITHLEQLLMAVVRPHQILLGANGAATPAGSAGSTEIGLEELLSVRLSLLFAGFNSCNTPESQEL